MQHIAGARKPEKSNNATLHAYQYHCIYIYAAMIYTCILSENTNTTNPNTNFAASTRNVFILHI